MRAQAYALIENAGKIFCSEFLGDEWASVPMRGDIGSSFAWAEALEQLDQRHNESGKLAGIKLLLLHETMSVVFLNEISNQLKCLDADDWNLYPMDWLLTWQGSSGNVNAKWINQVLLPNLQKPRQAILLDDNCNVVEGADQSKEQALLAQCLGLGEQLGIGEKEITRLKKDNDILRRKLSSQPSRLNDELVNTYLSCVFNNYWGHVKPDDHAVMTRQLNKPELRSPVKEPSDKMIERVTQEIQRLPSDQVEHIKYLCKSITSFSPSIICRHSFEFLLECTE